MAGTNTVDIDDHSRGYQHVGVVAENAQGDWEEATWSVVSFLHYGGNADWI